MAIHFYASFGGTETKLRVLPTDEDDEVYLHISSQDGHSVTVIVSAETARRLRKLLKKVER